MDTECEICLSPVPCIDLFTYPATLTCKCRPHPCPKLMVVCPWCRAHRACDRCYRVIPHIPDDAGASPVCVRNI